MVSTLCRNMHTVLTTCADWEKDLGPPVEDIIFDHLVFLWWGSLLLLASESPGLLMQVSSGKGADFSSSDGVNRVQLFEVCDSHLAYKNLHTGRYLHV